MAWSLSRMSLLLSLAFLGSAAHAAPPPVTSQAQLQAIVASGQSTPLDALTPYGKRSLLRSVRWNDDGSPAGFNTWVAIRELNKEQLSALFTYLGQEQIIHAFAGDLDGAPVRLPDPSPAIEERLREFDRLANQDAEQRRPGNAGTVLGGSDALLAHYRRLFGERMTPSALKQQALGDLSPLFEAAVIMNFYHPGSALPDLLNAHRELAARGVATARWYDGRTLDALLAARRFEDARAFAAGRPALARRGIPKVADPLGAAFRGRSVYRYDKASDTLTREAAPVAASGGLQVVMFVQEHCQPTARALKAVREDAELQTRLRQANLLLVTSPTSEIPYGFMSRWNAANPALPMRATTDVDEWRDIMPTGVPEFFVLKDGKPVGRLVGGWPPEGNKAALLSLLDAAAR